ncbi:MAG: hypothetical protein ACI9KE_006489 [Polyangiales bacterium]|jgi:hypothetical protein
MSRGRSGPGALAEVGGVNTHAVVVDGAAACFRHHIMTCPRQSAMRVIAVATETGDIRAVLGIASRARPPPRTLQHLELDFAAAPCTGAFARA